MLRSGLRSGAPSQISGTVYSVLQIDVRFIDPLSSRDSPGDWQPAPDDVHDGDRRDVPDLPLDDDPGADDDDRVEGTTLYLAPECVQGARPSTAADACHRSCMESELRVVLAPFPCTAPKDSPYTGH